MKANIKDVAKEAGVSVVTVSRVINKAPTVRESSIQKVMAAVKKLNYQPSAAAQSLARGKTNVIGIIIPNLTDPFIMKVVDTVDRYLEEKGYSLALSILDEEKKDEEKRRHFLFEQKRVDGLLVITPIFGDEGMEFLSNSQIPYVVLDNQRYPFTEPSVVVDNFKGAYEATRHLIELGHQKIAYIGGPESFLSAIKRGQGFETALEEIGLKPYKLERGDYEISTGYRITEKWIEAEDLPTAILAGDDHIAFGVINALTQKGYEVPEDISVVGFDDHPFASELKPYLTTVRQPAVEMGKVGVDSLFKLMKDQEQNNLVIKLNPKLIKRESTAKL